MITEIHGWEITMQNMSKDHPIGEVYRSAQEWRSNVLGLCSARAGGRVAALLKPLN